jgi:translation initiation factor IF-3
MAVPNKSFQPKPGGFKKPNTGGGFNKGGFNRGRFAPRKEAEHRINHFIRVPQVRLVGDNVTPGVYATNEAIKMAQEQALDLVEISPNADPPVCKIIDYNKFLYDKKKKEKEMKANAKVSEVKEIRFTPNTDEHDFNFKAKHAENFLKDG